MQQRDAWRLAALFTAAFLVGTLTNHTKWCLLLTAVGYIAWMHTKLELLLSWLRDHKTHEPPEAPGAFEELSLEIDYLRERHKKRKKKLASYLKQFQQATRALPDATVVLDAQNEVRWANAAARRDLGIRWPEDIGQRVTNLVRLPALRAFIEQAHEEQAIEIQSPTDTKRYLSVLLAPYGKDQQLLVARDVTQLHRANEIRRDFVANVSHELRTPITVFRGYLENLEAQADLAPPSWRPALAQMSAHSERMRQLVEELLLLSNLEREDRVPQPEIVNVSEIVADAHARARELSQQREHLFALEIDPHLRLRGSKTELYSAFSNLIFNAVHYTPERGVIHIRWYRDDAGAHFEVEDNGIGIGPEHLPRLTERFYRVEQSRVRSAGGTGLGLAIVKHVLVRHNATLEIESTPGKGSRFRCDFPLSEVVEVRPETNAPAVRDAG
jgi:two-component system phosphate regulon sensor histidine kinase PhoR